PPWMPSVGLKDSAGLAPPGRSGTWPQAAQDMRCQPSQLTRLKTARFAAGMVLAMRITQWIGRPAADFIYPARW
ncbi:MAG: hypothetical protein J2P50_20185, partial [Hyphomicrobiaceae bacterium]|nr:hypothetical protein [Hyphomicrobiaceae bacterium]